MAEFLEPDPIVSDVIMSIETRSQVGMEHYGKTMADNPLPASQWALEARHEAQDLALYLRRLETACEALERENLCLRQQLTGPFVPPARRTSHLQDLVVKNENGDVVIDWSVAWSTDNMTGRATEIFVHDTGRPGSGSLQDGLDRLGRLISKIIQGRHT
jgi:hypothetical protein